MSEWKETKLGDVAEITSSKRIFYSEYVENGVPFYRSKEIIDLFNRRDIQTELYITEKRFKEIEEKFGVPNADDILLTSVGSLGIPYKVKPKDRFYFKDGNLTWFRNLDKKKINPDFLFTWLSSNVGKQKLDEVSIGSTQAALTISGLKTIEILLPDLKTQTAIASVLSSLDDKIDLLHRQNATLEKMAETLFRQWFVEEAKEEWEMGKVSDYALRFKDSIQPQKNKSTLYFHYSIPSFDNGKNPIKELGSEIQSNKYKVPQYCILFSKLNPHKDKRVWLLQNEVESNAICSTEFQVVLPKKKNHLYFLYGWLTFNANYSEIASGVGGTSGSHQRIDPSTLYDFQCPFVPESVITNYNIQIEPIFRKQVINQTQIRTLTALRDTLLPKLMSGEVKIKI